MSYLASLDLALDSKISSAVTLLEQQNPNVGFAEMKDALDGHQWCSSDPEAYGLSIEYTSITSLEGISPAPFHPTPTGQQVLAGIVETDLKKLLETN